MAWRSSWTGRWGGSPGSGSPQVVAGWCCGGITGVREVRGSPTARKFGGEHPHRGGAPVTKIGAGANCGRGSESGGEPGPKTKLLRQSFGTTAAQEASRGGAGMRR